MPERRSFRWCVIDRNNEVITHSEFREVADAFADVKNYEALGQLIPGDFVDMEGARVL